MGKSRDTSCIRVFLDHRWFLEPLGIKQLATELVVANCSAHYAPDRITPTERNIILRTLSKYEKKVIKHARDLVSFSNVNDYVVTNARLGTWRADGERSLEVRRKLTFSVHPFESNYLAS